MDTEIEKWRVASAEWLDLQDAADILEQTKADVFAEITSRQDAKTTAEKERLARLCADWTEFRAKMIDAVSKARRAKMRVKYADLKIHSAISANANSRAERKKF